MLSLLLIIATFTGLFVTSYTFTYNNTLIPSYLTPGRVPKAKIKQYVQGVSSAYNVSLLELNIQPDEAQADAAPGPGKSVRFTPLRGTTASASELSNVVVKLVFSLGVSLSAMLIILILCELMEFLDSGARVVSFKFVINVLIVLLAVVQPFMVLSIAIFQDIAPHRLLAGNKVGSVLFGAALVAWFYALHKFGALSSDFIPDQYSDSVLSSSKSLVERKINEISIAGITIIAVLSGVGSTSTPYRHFPTVYKAYQQSRSSAKGFSTSASSYRRNRVTQSELNNLIQSYNHTQSLIEKRGYQLDTLMAKDGAGVYNNSNPSANSNVFYSGAGSSSLSPISSHSQLHNNHKNQNPSKIGGLFHKVQSFASLSSLSMRKENSEETELTNEIESLKTLKNHIYDDFLKLLEKFKAQQDENKSQNALRVLTKWFDWGFGVYCVYRIINVLVIKLIYQAITGRPAGASAAAAAAPQVGVHADADDTGGEADITNDALAITLAKLILSLFAVPMTETQLVYQISFLLSGGLFICSISNVVTTLQSFRKFVPASPVGKYSSAAITWLKHLIVSELLGIYVMSTALLIRTNLPENLSNQVSKILSLTGSGSSASSHSSIQEVAFIDSWFDKVFAVTCVVTLVVLLLRNFLDDDSDMDEYDEESMVEAGKLA